MDNNQFLSNENKGMVWQLLLDNGAFSNIPDNNFNRVKTLYETTLTEISTMNNDNLTDKNKLTIQTMMNKLPYLKKTEISKPLEEVQIKLDKDFESKREEFFKLVKRPTPEEVKFHEDNDEPMDISDMDRKISNMIKLRETELNQVSPNNQNINNQKKSEISETKIENIDNRDRLPGHNGDCKDYMWSQWANTSTQPINVKEKEKEKEKRVSFETENFDLDFI